MAESLRQAARIAGLNIRTVEGWRAQGLIEPAPDGGWSPEALLEVAEERARRSPSDPEAARWAVERLKWQAKIEKLKHDELEGSLISREEVEASRVAQVLVLKNSLLPIGQRVADKIAATDDKREIAAVIEKEILSIIRIYAGDD